MSEKSTLPNAKEIRELALKYALQNAVLHDGRAELKAVISKVIAEKPEVHRVIREIIPLIREVVDEVNGLSINEQRRILQEKYPELMVKKAVKEEKKLPPLPNVEKYGKVITRFAPNPDFVLHLGNARPAVLSHEYARMYGGKFILRFDDTDPKVKKPMPEAYELIKEDLEWLGIEWDEEYVQSKRLELFYSYAKELIKLGGAYVDTCSANEFRQYRDSMKPCPHRDQSVEENLELWDKMLEGYFGEGEAVLRVKTDLKHPDPSVRDWVAFRIIDTSKNPHPIVGSRYIVWPTYNFASAIDDHVLGVTHILRAKEHMTNTVKQKFLYNYFGWEYPETIHFGRLKLKGFILSKSLIKSKIERGEFEGVDDPRLGTLAALRRRGFTAEAIKALMIDVGVKASEATISMENLAAINRKIVDPKSPRILFVEKPVKVIVEGVENYETTIPFHPDNKELGFRRIVLKGEKGKVKVYISLRDSKDLKPGSFLRLLELFNIEILDVNEKYVLAKFAGTSLSEARRRRAPIIQWVPAHENVSVMVKKPVGNELALIEGLAEKAIEKFRENTILQFYRFGFVRIDRIDNGKYIVYFAHE